MLTEVEAMRFCHVDRSEGDAEQRRNEEETSARSVAPRVICAAEMESVYPRSRCLRSILCVATLLEDSGRHDGVVTALLVSYFVMSTEVEAKRSAAVTKRRHLYAP